MEPAHRLLRALGFGCATGVGFHLAGFPPSAFVSFAFVIGVLFILNVWTYIGATVAAAAIIWGGLVAAHMAPQFSSLQKSVDVVLNQLGISTEDQGHQDSVSAPVAPKSSLAQKLDDLKLACDKGLLTKAECDSARGKIIAEFNK